jgi:hypothetical protein
MTERTDAADGVTGRCLHLGGICAPSGAPGGSRREPGFVEPIGATDQRNNRFVVDHAARPTDHNPTVGKRKRARSGMVDEWHPDHTIFGDEHVGHLDVVAARRAEADGVPRVDDPEVGPRDPGNARVRCAPRRRAVVAGDLLHHV